MTTHEQSTGEVRGTEPLAALAGNESEGPEKAAAQLADVAIHHRLHPLQLRHFAG